MRWYLEHWNRYKRIKAATPKIRGGRGTRFNEIQALPQATFNNEKTHDMQPATEWVTATREVASGDKRALPPGYIPCTTDRMIASTLS